MSVNPFYLVIYDEDGKLFSIVGPMTDDTPWIDRVKQAASNGRKVHCNRLNSNNQATVNETTRNSGHRYTQSQLV